MPEVKRDRTGKEKRAAAKRGHTLPGTVSYPIDNAADLRNAISSYGRAKPADRARLRRYIARRARALGLADKIPRQWLTAGGAIKAVQWGSAPPDLAAILGLTPAPGPFSPGQLDLAAVKVAPAPAAVELGRLLEAKVIAGRYRPELHPRGPSGRFAAKPGTRPVPQRASRGRTTPHAGTLRSVSQGRRLPGDDVAAARQAGLVTDVQQVATARRRLAAAQARLDAAPHPGRAPSIHAPIQERRAHERRLTANERARRNLADTQQNLADAETQHGTHRLTAAGRAALAEQQVHERSAANDHPYGDLLDQIDRNGKLTGDVTLPDGRVVPAAEAQSALGKQGWIKRRKGGGWEVTGDTGHRVLAEHRARLTARQDDTEADVAETKASDVKAGDLVGGYRVERVETKNGRIHLHIGGDVRLVIPADRTVPVHKTEIPPPPPKPTPKPRKPPKPKTDRMSQIRDEAAQVDAKLGPRADLGYRVENYDPRTDPLGQRWQEQADRWGSYADAFEEWQRTGNAEPLLSRKRATKAEVDAGAAPGFDRKYGGETLRESREAFLRDYKNNPEWTDRSIARAREQEDLARRVLGNYVAANPPRQESREPDTNPALHPPFRADVGSAPEGASEEMIGKALAVRDLGRRIDEEATRRLSEAGVKPMSKDEYEKRRREAKLAGMRARSDITRADNDRAVFGRDPVQFRRIKAEKQKALDAEAKSKIALSDLEVQRERERMIVRDARMAVLRDVRDFGGTINLNGPKDGVSPDGAPITYNDAQARKWADEAAPFLPSQWIDTFPTMDFGHGPWRGYAYADDDSLVTSSRDGGTSDRSGYLATSAHELTHIAEGHYPGIRAMEWAYWTHRTTTPGDPSKPKTGQRKWSSENDKLTKIKPGSAYEDHEVARPDEFANPYIGKYYVGGGRESARQSWEVASMGSEILSVGESYGDDDEDFRHFTLGMWAVV